MDRSLKYFCLWFLYIEYFFNLCYTIFSGFNNGIAAPTTNTFVTDTAFSSVFGSADPASTQSAGIYLLLFD